MSAVRLFKYLRLAYFSKSPTERVIFRTIRKLEPTRLVEIGIGDGELAERMIELAGRYADSRPVHYTGIDLFEARPAGTPGLSLKQVHRRLAVSAARVQLVPGDPYGALARQANSLLGTDLLVVRAAGMTDAMERAWYYVPRMLHADSVVLVEQPGATTDVADAFAELDRVELQRLAAAHTPHRAHHRAA